MVYFNYSTLVFLCGNAGITWISYALLYAEIPKVPVHNRMIAGPPVEETIIRAPRKVDVTLTEEETRG